MVHSEGRVRSRRKGAGKRATILFIGVSRLRLQEEIREAMMGQTGQLSSIIDITIECGQCMIPYGRCIRCMTITNDCFTGAGPRGAVGFGVFETLKDATKGSEVSP